MFFRSVQVPDIAGNVQTNMRAKERLIFFLSYIFKKIAEVIKPSSSAFSNAMLEDVYFIEKRLRQLAGLKKQGQDETKIDENAEIQVAIFDTFNKNTIEILFIFENPL